MTHLSRLLENSGIPEDLKRQIREAAGKDLGALMAAAKMASYRYTTGMSNDNPHKGPLNYLADVLAAQEEA